MPGYPGLVKTLVPPGVYTPQEDTDLLVGALRDEPLPDGADVLDVGTGSGALAIEAARRGTRVTAVDVSWRAVCTARLNARLARLPVRIRHGNLFAPVRGQSFDLILANPPYVPTPGTDHVPRGAARSWDAGRDGRLVLDRICREAPALLRPGGVLLVVHSSLSCPDRTLAHLRGSGLKASVTRRRVIPFGPVLRSREGWLRERSLVAGRDQKEELVVVRAEVPV
ncbi:methyltransferase [Streptomyces viridochromogenes]|uniref:Methyltransferase n=1 Tax=Streptomyces viridochromogenes TaxID=1938 RepID=A0A0J8CGT1_STRVR|nr:HemK2/MTQ2 family protein methyltransferase [Streptomyces viridochromogenes]KMS77195.1 methyltransferase [Streptomyces viridochromogenes]KOG09439.1 methyltransferase [Streptomyces viridochromogenes]KOG27345.1 methyltransferase [Streptomyces viridochromogenes]